MIIILGTGRSGTTWLGKIFDSHPDTIYRHEPDSVAVNTDIPFLLVESEVGDYVDAAAGYLDSLIGVNEVKVRGSLPVFAKSYRPPLGTALIRGWIVGVKGLQTAFRKSAAFRHAPVPDLVTPRRRDGLRYVVKSVSSLGRATLFARAKPDAKILHIIRHPCAVVSSALRGKKLNLLNPEGYVEDIAATAEAQRYALTAERLRSASLEEQLAARWLVGNERMMTELADHANYRLVVYEDLCERPFEVSRELFAFCDLPWSGATERFLQQCIDYEGGRERFFQIVRSPIKAATKWKQELTADQIDRILAVVASSRPGALYMSRDDAAPAAAVAQD